MGSLMARQYKEAVASGYACGIAHTGAALLQPLAQMGVCAAYTCYSMYVL